MTKKHLVALSSIFSYFKCILTRGGCQLNVSFFSQQSIHVVAHLIGDVVNYAQVFCAGMAARVGVVGPVAFTGGVARNPGIRRALEEELKVTLLTPDKLPVHRCLRSCSASPQPLVPYTVSDDDGLANFAVVNGRNPML